METAFFLQKKKKDNLATFSLFCSLLLEKNKQNKITRKSIFV